MKVKRIISLAILSALVLSLVSQPTYKATAATDEVKMVAADINHMAIIKSDNSLWMSGKNDCGQLGTGDFTDSTDPVQVMTGVKAVALGKFHTLALKTDGSLYGFGCNLSGQLGITLKKDVYELAEPIIIMSGVHAIAAGENFSMALKTDGSLYSWGSNSYYQLGIDDSDKSSTSRVADYKPTKILTGVASISAGSHHAAAVKTDGSLWTWGNNSPHAQCGFVTTAGYVLQPTKIMSSGVKSVSCGDNNTAILKTNGELYMCGSNFLGELGTGADTVDKPGTGGITRSEVPIKVLSGVKAVSALGESTQVIKTDGSLWVWGCVDGVVVPKAIKRTTGIKSLADGIQIAIKTDGSLYDWRQYR